MSVFFPLSSRRHFLQTTLAATASLALPLAQAQDVTHEAYDVSAWAGPLAGFSLVDTDGKQWTPAEFKGRARAAIECVAVFFIFVVADLIRNPCVTSRTDC